MIHDSFENRVKIQDLIENQIPEFISSENPKFSEFLKQYYISQEIQGGNIDLVENLIDYLRLDNLNNSTLNQSTTLSADVSSTNITGGITSEIFVASTKGFPAKYGLIQIGTEIITYKSKTSTSFVDCVRGFSGITEYKDALKFSSSSISSHNSGSSVINLSVLFLQEFYTKIKSLILPELQSSDLYSELNINNFLKNTTSLYKSKGSRESFKILFRALFGITPTIVDLENYIIKLSNADYLRRIELLVQLLSETGDPSKLVGQQIQKTNNPDVFGSVSEVEILSRSGRTYYKIFLYVGNDDSHINYEDLFESTPVTKTIIPILSSDNYDTITVDSTIGFPASGSFLFGTNEIFYTNKSVNQFFGCYTAGHSHVNLNIPTKSIINSKDTYFGYENGDVTKKLEFLLLSNISDIIIDNTAENAKHVFSNEDLYVGSLGKLIRNRENIPTEIFSNSLVYNTSVRIKLSSYNKPSASATVDIELDKSFLKVGDTVEFLERNTEILVQSLSNATIESINGSEIRFSSSLDSLNDLKTYDIRRKLKTSTSSFIPLSFDSITSDVSNLYYEDDNTLYIASNSLPSYPIQNDIIKSTVSSLKNYDSIEEKYTTLELTQLSSFVTGDKVYYSYTGDPIGGLIEGEYYLSITNYKDIKLYNSTSGIVVDNHIYFSSLPGGTHTFTLVSQKTDDDKLYPAKILKKISLNQNYLDVSNDEIGSDTIGIMVNGVEILSPKSTDKIYYGPLESVQIFKQGSGYDVINPPFLKVEGNAKLQPVVQGGIEKVFVDPVYFDVREPLVLKVIGGNGKNATLKPVLKNKSREISFNAKTIDDGGGLSYDDETITFLTDHNLYDGQKVYYSFDENKNQKIGISTAYGLNQKTGYLENNQGFHIEIINSKTVKLFTTLNDYRAGINTVGFSTEGNFGIHRFRTEPRKTLDSVVVVNPGEGYTNRKLIVSQSGISTVSDSITFKNHGFSTGELVTYDYETTNIGGLTRSNQYYILKIDSNSFRLCDAGPSGTDSSNYNREKYVDLTSTGSGYQYFNYPDIQVTVTYQPGQNNQINPITLTPVVKGSIVDTYVYDNGVGYGSTILNVEIIPSVSVLQGKEASMSAILVDGVIDRVNIFYGGYDFYSVPDLIVESEKGIGAVLRAEISNGQITNVVVIDGGKGYSEDDITIKFSFSGKDYLPYPRIRQLTVDNCFKYGKQYQTRRDPSLDLLYKNIKNQLQYVVCGYFDKLSEYFNESSNIHSPIIGWAYDGNPIYGPYGYSDPLTISPIKQLNPSYVQSTSDIVNRPSEFASGYFIDDYKFDGSGDLDIYNGRWCVTPEYPNGIYAYFATIKVNADNEIIGKFPYFVGTKYRSKKIIENSNDKLDQTYDFKNSSLLRNTLPFGPNDQNSLYDFYSSNLDKQITKITSTSKGSVTKIEVVDPGLNYKVGDKLNFKNYSLNNKGFGATASVKTLKGKTIDAINNVSKTYLNAKLYSSTVDGTKISILPNHEIKPNTKIEVTGFTSSFSKLNGTYEAKVNNFYSTLIDSIPEYSAGIVTDIKVSAYPAIVSIGSSIKITTGTSSSSYDQYFNILNYYEDYSIIRCKKVGDSGLSTSNSPVHFLPNFIDINYGDSSFKSSTNYKRYFNPQQSVGVGTFTGSQYRRNFYVGNNLVSKDIPIQTIYLPNHGLRTGQKVLFEKPTTGSAILVQNSPDGSSWNIPETGDQIELYIINKNSDHIGITTQVGFTTSTNGLYFPSILNSGSDNNEYSFNTLYTEESCKISQNITTVSISTVHNLKDTDKIELNVVSNQSVGIGTSGYLNVKYFSDTKSLSLRELQFDPSNVSISENTLSIQDHRLNNGDKVYYISTSAPSGITTGVYHVNRLDDNTLRLSETFKDSTVYPYNTLQVTTQGIGTQSIFVLHPEISIIRNNDLVFDVSDSSLQGYQLKFYYDEEFKNEFKSPFIVGVGTVGVTSTSRLNLNYDASLPKELYYTIVDSSLNKITSSISNNNNSKIKYINSIYSNEYDIFGVTDTTYQIYLQENPEINSYAKEDCDILEYTTNSINANGSVNEITLTDGGNIYSDLPYFYDSDSVNGTGLVVNLSSNNIGKILSKEIMNGGFEYPTDPTLLPSLKTSKNCYINNSYYLKDVSVISGGSNYPSAPNLVVIDTDTRDLIDQGILIPEMSGSEFGNSNIFNVTIDSTPRGLPITPVTVVAVDNSNGIRIDRVTSSSSGIMTCILKTPIIGFPEDPFAAGDQVYVENIDIIPDSGIGWNSKDHGYVLFDVIKYTAQSDPGEMEIKIPKLYGNPGIAVTFQINTFASIVKKENYPVFKTTHEYSPFIDGESILIIESDESLTKTDLVVKSYSQNYVKLFGSTDISKGTKIKGSTSNSIATVYDVTQASGSYDVSSSRLVEYGWKSDSGKLNYDTQFIADNDYYQNLSYTIKSEKTWEEIKTPVNSLVHPLGTKNFADTQIQDKVTRIIDSVGINSSATLEITKILDTQVRVDTIKNFDMVVDYDPTSQSSKLLKFNTVQLSDYFGSRSNRVLNIDNISGLFSSSDDANFSEDLVIKSLSPEVSYYKVLVQIKSSPENIERGINHHQLTEAVLLHDGIFTSYISEKTVYTNDTYGYSYGKLDVESFGSGIYNLLFIPNDPYNYNYDIKILSSYFGINSGNSENYSDLYLGPVFVRGTTNYIQSNDSDINILSLDKSTYNSFIVEVYLHNRTTNTSRYVELFGLYGGTGSDVILAESSFTANDDDLSIFTGISTFGASIDGSNLVLSFDNYENNTFNIKTKIYGFGDSSVGVGTYKFSDYLQDQESVRTARIDTSVHDTGTSAGISTIREYDGSLFSSIKSLVRVSVGDNLSLHQVATLYDGDNIFITEAPLVSTGSSIGHFSSSLDQKTIKLEFTRNTEFSNENVNITHLDYSFYEFLDELNEPEELNLGYFVEDHSIGKYYGFNSAEINRLKFPLNYQKTPIFEKSFDPNNNLILDQSTGIITIDDHFFSTGERLIYRPDSSFTGIGYSSIHIQDSINSSGVTTTVLPEDVYAIRIDSNQFKLASNYENSISGIGVTITYLGEGNAHKLEMYKKNEKSLITINNLVQYPLTYTGIGYSLTNNNGSIGVGNSFFNLTGISSISPIDILKVDDEYMKVINVGIGTTDGSINYLNGDLNIVEVERGFFGSISSSHTDQSRVDLYKGAYNISGDSIYFAEPPRGNIGDLITKDERNLFYPRASFSGRVFLKQDYSQNEIYDDISYEFDGKTSEFTLTRLGINTAGFTTETQGGSGVLFINGILQTPLTNNLGDYYNYSLDQDVQSGITTIKFTGLTTEGGIYVSDSDVNQNQLPRGGLIVSLGSTSGLGYAPLVGARVKLNVDEYGTIVDPVVSIARTGKEIGITTAEYDHINGILTIESESSEIYKLRESNSNYVKLVGLGFTCDSQAGIISYFPYTRNEEYPFGVIGLGTNTVSLNVGVSTLKHYYVGYGTAFVWLHGLTPGSGYREPLSYVIRDAASEYIHRFVDAEVDSIYTSTNTYEPIFAEYNQKTGDLILSIEDHGLTTSDTVGIKTGSIRFTCSSDGYLVPYAYPRSTDPVAGISTEILSYTTNSITVNVGGMGGSGAEIDIVVGAGGTLGFTVSAGGTNYINPILDIEPPSYDNLEMIGVSRLSVGLTTETGTGMSINVDVIPSRVYNDDGTVGIGSTLFEVSSFEISRNGYGFRRGDIIKPVGLVTAAGLSEPIEEFKLYVLSTYTDNFAAWQFGEMDLMDNIKPYQNGIRKQFPLYYNGDLVSFQRDENNLEQSQDIDFNSVLVVFVNGILQDPGISYEFEGGTSFRFLEAPKPEDVIQIYFYVGTSNVDSSLVLIDETIQPGDQLKVKSINSRLDETEDQNSRMVFDILSTDIVETNLYFGDGINSEILRPVDWVKQKGDLYINEVFYSKSRESIKAQIYPTAKVIYDFNETDGFIYVDNAELFAYEGDSAVSSDKLDLILAPYQDNNQTGIVTATVSADGTISTFNIVNSGFGYTATTRIDVSNPIIGIGSNRSWYNVGIGTIGDVGIGTTATGSVTIVDGAIGSVSVVNAGSGYTFTNPPQVMLDSPPFELELLTTANSITGFNGTIVGIATTNGINSTLALEFTIRTEGDIFTDLTVGTPIYVYDTRIGSGVTSIESSDTDIIGISTEYLNNVYKVHDISVTSPTATIKCNIIDDPNLYGLTATGFSTDPVGRYSFGKISGFTRSSNPISIGVTSYTVSGLSTYPTIQRRGKTSGTLGMRRTGSL